jgi:hypothetical protein
MIQGVDGEVDIQGGPIEMMRAGQEDVRQLGNRGLPKPREVLE